MSDSDFAKTHLRDHLGSLIVSPVSEGFWSIYKSSKELCERNEQMDQVLRTFQNMLTHIPDWTDETLTTEVDRIVTVTKCSYLDDLIMGVFISYMKSFASLQYRGSLSEIKIDFDRPTLGKFIHELYKHSARKLWQTAYLFKTVGVSSELQARNRQEIETIVSSCLEQVIRAFLPWESITKKYFNQPDSVPQPEPEAEEEPEKEEEKKSVSFGEDDESEEDAPKLIVGEEDATIEFEEDDPLKDLEKRATESLVINL